MNADVMRLRSGAAPARSSVTHARPLRVACRGADLPGYGFDFPCPDAAHGAGAAGGAGALSGTVCGDGGYRSRPRASLSAALAVSSGLVLGIGSLITSLLMLAS